MTAPSGRCAKRIKTRMSPSRASFPREPESIRGHPGEKPLVEALWLAHHAHPGGFLVRRENDWITVTTPGWFRVRVVDVEVDRETSNDHPRRTRAPPRSWEHRDLVEFAVVHCKRPLESASSAQAAPKRAGTRWPTDTATIMGTATIIPGAARDSGSSGSSTESAATSSPCFCSRSFPASSISPPRSRSMRW